ncbi:MAG: protein kinase [Chlamydiia bacterium]|nr:protein kinase [Chlamydiia bacterium]MCP5508951.1 protein kinase [Chlamydiales bacterium]
MTLVINNRDACALRQHRQPLRPCNRKIETLRRVLEKNPSFQKESSPLSELDKLFTNTKSRLSVCGVEIASSNHGIYIKNASLGSGNTSSVELVQRVDKETGEVREFAELSSQNSSVLERCIEIKAVLEKSTSVDFMKHLALPLKSIYDENNRVQSIRLCLQGEDLSKKNTYDSPLHYFSRELASAAKGLAILHEAGIVHGDIKLDNILSSKGEEPAKLADFGFSRINPEPNSKIDGASACFAPEVYASIEDMVEGKGTVNAKTDIYSWGLMMRELLMQKLLPQVIGLSQCRTQRLFSKNIDQNKRAEYGRIYYLPKSKSFNGFAKDEDYRTLFEKALYKSTISDETRDALKQFIDYAFTCTSLDPNDRPSAKALSHFLSEFSEQVHDLEKQEQLSLPSFSNEANEAILESYP